MFPIDLKSLPLKSYCWVSLNCSCGDTLPCKSVLYWTLQLTHPKTNCCYFQAEFGENHTWDPGDLWLANVDNTDPDGAMVLWSMPGSYTVNHTNSSLTLTAVSGCNLSLENELHTHTKKEKSAYFSVYRFVYFSRFKDLVQKVCGSFIY